MRTTKLMAVLGLAMALGFSTVQAQSGAQGHVVMPAAEMKWGPAPPGLPADRAAALQKAFDDTMTDKAFLEEAKTSKLELDPVSGKEIQELVAEANATPKPIVAKVAAILSAGKKDGGGKGKKK